MKKYIIAGGAAIALALGAIAVYAAYDITGSSGTETFSGGVASNLIVDANETDLDGILPTETRTMAVDITNPNNLAVQVTGLTITFHNAVCAFTNAPAVGLPTTLPPLGGVTVTVNVTMGDADPACEGNAGLTFTATAAGTLP